MTDLRNNFEGGTDGATVTAVGSGGVSGDTFTAVSPWVYTNVQSRDLMAVRVQNPGTSVFVLRWATVGSVAALRAYIYLTSLPTADITAMHLGDAVSVSFVINSVGKARLSASGTQWTATANFPINQWVRCELFSTASTNSANGTAKAAYYLGDSIAVVEESTLITGLNTAGATGAFGNSRFGKNSSGSYTGDIYLDNVASSYGTGVTDYIGPVAAVEPSFDPEETVWNGTSWV
jgi:hypothetical protein